MPFYGRYQHKIELQMYYKTKLYTRNSSTKNSSTKKYSTTSFCNTNRKHYLCYINKRFMKLIETNIQAIVALCKKHKVNKLFVFGSILTNRFNNDSDVDLVVDFKKAEVEDYFDNYFDFKYSLEDLFGREVDLLEEQTIKNPYLKKNVDATKALIYG